MDSPPPRDSSIRTTAFVMATLLTPPPMPAATLTFDVEDWEHANFQQLRGREAEIAASADARRYAMDANVDRWIQILAETGATSTCFVLGEFAQRYPASVRRLAAAGHEIASHGATHDLVYDMTREQFRE